MANVDGLSSLCDGDADALCCVVSKEHSPPNKLDVGLNVLGLY